MAQLEREPIWVDYEVILAIHEEQLAEHGGGSGIRDPGLLESALGRPQNAFAYGEPDLADLAAAYAFGIARNHPFVDGNKRTAFVACELFLVLNGYELIASDENCLFMTLDLASCEIGEADDAAWLRANTAPV